jgi:hypothetical protein
LNCPFFGIFGVQISQGKYLLAIVLDFLQKIGNFSAFSTLSPDPKIKFYLV